MFTDGTFQLVIDDPAVADKDRVRRVVLCSGKIYYTLQAAREKEKGGFVDAAIVRVEQPYPFPEKELGALLAKYGRKQEVCWVQEEPKNRGAWTFMEPRLRAMLPDTILTYIGRDAAASPATGSMKDHQKEERDIVSAALELSKRSAAVTPRQDSGPSAWLEATLSAGIGGSSGLFELRDRERGGPEVLPRVRRRPGPNLPQLRFAQRPCGEVLR